jgi:hypothetical protein
MVKLPRRIPHRGGPDGSALARRYPDWFALGAVAVPAGWVALVERLFAELDATLSAPERTALQVAAVKERGGRLVIELYEAVPAARRLIDDAAKAAARICQNCGAAGRHKSFAGWSATLCADCRKRLGAIRIGG